MLCCLYVTPHKTELDIFRVDNILLGNICFKMSYDEKFQTKIRIETTV